MAAIPGKLSPALAQDRVAFLQRLIQTPSVNGQQNEAAVVEVVAAEAERLGLPYQIMAKDDRRPNIFVGTGFAEASGTLLVAHTDTVPVGSRGSWEEDPFAGQVHEGKLYGRGAFDCKGGIAVSLYAMKLLADEGKPSAAKFVGVADEESGADSLLGLAYLLEQGLAAQQAVYTYGSSDRQQHITIGHRGLIRLWVTCTGQSAHSGSKSWQDGTRGESAIDGILDLLQELRTFEAPGNNPYFPGYRFVLTPTLIEGGSGESLVPDTAKVLLDIRTLPEHNNAEIIERITQVTHRLSRPQRKYRVAVKNSLPGALTDPHSQIVQDAQRLNHQLFDVESALVGSGPANEGYMLIQHGIPTIMGYGPYGAHFHAANEYIEVESLSHMTELLARLAIGD